MSATWELFTKWCAAKNVPNDRQGALALGVKPQTVANWKDGRNGGLAVLERMANDLGEDVVPYMVQAMREANTANRAEADAWKRLGKKLGAAAIAALAIGFSGAPTPAAAAVSTSPDYALCEVKRRRRPRRWCGFVAYCAAGSPCGPNGHGSGRQGLPYVRRRSPVPLPRPELRRRQPLRPRALRVAG